MDEVLGKADQGVDFPFLGDFQGAGGTGDHAGAGGNRYAAQPLPQGFVGRIGGIVGGIQEGVHHHIAGLQPMPVVGARPQDVAHLPVPGRIKGRARLAGSSAAGVDPPGHFSGADIGTNVVAKGRMGVHALANVLHRVHRGFLQVGDGCDVPGFNAGFVPLAAVEGNLIGPFHCFLQTLFLQRPDFLGAQLEHTAEKVRSRRVFPHQLFKIDRLVIKGYVVQVFF